MKGILRTLGLTACLSLLFTSCDSGWSEEIKTDLTRSCEDGARMAYGADEAKSICSCYIQNLVSKYPNMDYTSAQNSEVLEECSADAKKKKQDEKSRLLEGEIPVDSDKLDTLVKDTTQNTPAH
jgi:hypothetical protein